MRTVVKYALVFLCLSANSYASPPSRTYTYTAGNTISPSEVTTNEDSIFNYLTRGVDTFASEVITTSNILNGTIANIDISGSAAIADTKLAQITTQNKVNVSAITGTLGISYGGTGQSVYTKGDMFYAPTNNSLDKLSIGTTNQVLKVSSGLPAWSSTISPSKFQVTPSGAQSNIAINTPVTVVFGTEVFDTGEDFSSNTFTAPETGSYLLTYSLQFTDFDTAATAYTINLVTSNRSYEFTTGGSVLGAGADGYWQVNFAILADMDALDTAYITVNQSGGTQQTDISAVSTFSGFLLFN